MKNRFFKICTLVLSIAAISSNTSASFQQPPEETFPRERKMQERQPTPDSIHPKIFGRVPSSLLETFRYGVLPLLTKEDCLRLSMTSKGFRAFTLSKKSLQISAIPETFKLSKILEKIPPLPQDFHNKTIILSDLFSSHYPILQNARHLDISHTNETVSDTELAYLPNLHHIQFSGYTWTRQAENESVNRALMAETLEKSLTNQLLMPLEQSNIRFQLAALYHDASSFIDIPKAHINQMFQRSRALYTHLQNDTYLREKRKIDVLKTLADILYQGWAGPQVLEGALDLYKMIWQTSPVESTVRIRLLNLYKKYLGQPSYDSLIDYRIARDVTTHNDNQITYAEHVLSLAGDDATLEDYQAARNAHATGRDNNRSLELANLILKRFPDDVTIHDLRAVRNIYFSFPMSDDASTHRAVEMAENILLHPDVTIGDYYSAQYAHYRMIFDLVLKKS